MSEIQILRPCDIENEIRLALKDFMTVYCRLLPDNLEVPSARVVATGGSSKNTIDTFMVTLQTRAETDEEAYELIRNAQGILEERVKEQFGALRSMSINSLASWGNDPARPELKLCSLTFLVTAHRESFTITK